MTHIERRLIAAIKKIAKTRSEDYVMCVTAMRGAKDKPGGCKQCRAVYDAMELVKKLEEDNHAVS